MSKKQIPVEEGLFYIPDSPEKEPYLIGSECTICGSLYFPKINACAKCGKNNTTKEKHIEGEGTIDTFSIVQSALPGFTIPSIQAYINLKAGLRVWGLITDCEPSEEALKIGMEVELVIAKVKEDAEGNEIISYQFRPKKKNDKGGQS